MDITAGVGAPVAGTQGIVSTASTVMVSAAPAASTTRKVNLLTAFNAGTIANTVTVSRNVGGSLSTMFKATLLAGESLQYVDSFGFSVLSASGGLKATTANQTGVPAARNQDIEINRISIATQIAGQFASFWRGTGFPAQGAIPGAAAICNAATLGAFPLATRSGAQVRQITGINVALSAVFSNLFIEDRLAHMGGLNGTLTTAQPVNVTVDVGTDNMLERIGSSDFSEVDWWLEWYTATGATIATPTLAVTFHDGTTGTANIWNAGSAALPASVAASRRYKIATTNGKFIKSIQTCTLSASTATAGSFGVTATRKHGMVRSWVANVQEDLRTPVELASKVPDNACLSTSILCNTTSTGTAFGSFRQTVTG